MPVSVSYNEFKSRKSSEDIECFCDYCKKNITKIKKNMYPVNEYLFENKKTFCNVDCKQKYFCLQIEYSCAFCSTIFYRVPSAVKSDRVYCSHSCAAKINNMLYKKREIQTICKKCNIEPVRSSGRKYCKSCYDTLFTERNIKNTDSFKNLTLKEVLELNDKYSEPQNKYNKIRDLFKRWNSHKANSPCQNCGYNKHTEFCHIKPIKNFSLDSKLSEINSEKNLIILCPNCHWEFDRGFLTNLNV